MKVTDQNKQAVKKRILNININVAILFIMIVILPKYFKNLHIFLILSLFYFVVAQVIHAMKPSTERSSRRYFKEFHLQLKNSIQVNVQYGVSLLIIMTLIFSVKSTFFNKISSIFAFIFSYLILLVIVKCIFLIISKINLYSGDRQPIKITSNMRKTKQYLLHKPSLTPIYMTNTHTDQLYDTFSLQLIRLEKEFSKNLKDEYLQQFKSMQKILFDLQKRMENYPTTHEHHHQISTQLRSTFQQLNETIHLYSSYSFQQQQLVQPELTHSPDEWLRVKMQQIEEELFNKMSFFYEDEVNQFIQHQSFLQQAINSDLPFKIDKN